MSFWGTLAGIGSSLIPGVGPFIAPLVGGVVNKFTDKGTPGAGSGGNGQQYSPEVQALMASLKAPGATGDNSATDSAEGFYKTILQGGQSETRALLGPDVDTILAQYDNAAKAAANLGPRGGGRAQVMADAGFQKAGAYGKLLGQAKTSAATGLANIGGEKMQAKTAKRGQDVSQLGALLGGKSAADRLAFEQQQAKDAQYGEMGKGIGSFLTNLLNGDLFGKNKKPNTTDFSSLVRPGDDSQFG